MQRKRTNITKVTIAKILKHGISPIIFTFALFISLIIINYIAAVKSPNFDVTKNKTNTLSKESLNLLDQINFDVKIKAFYTDAYRRRIRSLLDKYETTNNRIEVQFIDPLKNPVAASEYEVTQPGSIIFETANKQTRINPPIPGQNHGEREITIALFRLMSDQAAKTIYFTTGHGEYSITSTKPIGLNIIKDRLIEQN